MYPLQPKPRGWGLRAIHVRDRYAWLKTIFSSRLGAAFTAALKHERRGFATVLCATAGRGQRSEKYSGPEVEDGLR